MNNNNFKDIMDAKFSRRTILKSAGALSFLSLSQNVFASEALEIDFISVAENQNDTISVPEGFEWKKLISWGDPLFEGLDAIDNDKASPFNFTRTEQEKRFGACNDMMAIFPKKYQYPFPIDGDDWIACSNNEYVVPYLMIASDNGKLNPSPQEIEALYAAQGVSIYELKRQNNEWSVVINKDEKSGLNRRITPFTEVVFDGPAKNHPWIIEGAKLTNFNEASMGAKAQNKDGVFCGTMQNCAGGFTPWGTYLTAEENIDNMFFTSDYQSKKLENARNEDGFEFDEDSYGYANRWRYGGPDQYDLARNPHGPALYGWIVEIDPYDKNWTPRKRTALGRKKAECATCVIAKSGQIVTYSGDDQVNEFVYKFVSDGKFNSKNRIANRDLLSSGKLYAARFEKDGSGKWIEISLEAANKIPRSGFETPFKDYGDLMVRAREAARRLGATQMDRPEDVECPTDNYQKGQGAVFIACTGNTSQEGIEGNIANPRRKNEFGNNEKNYTGHIIRINENEADHCAINFTWEVFVSGGDHSAANVILEKTNGEKSNLSSWHDNKQNTKGDRFAMPDNLTFNGQRVFFTTDGTPDSFPCNDGVYAAVINNDEVKTVKRFLTGPIGAEITGPLFSSDFKTFFCGLQHVGSEDIKGNSYRGKDEFPPSKFPNNSWPRDTIIYVKRKDGKRI